jgi:cysteine synthase A
MAVIYFKVKTSKPAACSGLLIKGQGSGEIMNQFFADNSQSVGNTPLVRLNRVAPAGSSVFGKVEGRNPGYSVKCRIGVALIEDALERGALTPGMEIIEPTSGNTGIALAFVAAAKGIALTLTMPETMSIERRKILKAFGAKLMLTPGNKGMVGAVKEAERLAQEHPEKYLLLHQFKNPANPAAHVKTTGPEIWEATGGDVDVLVSGVGTGGTITGVARYFKQVRGKQILAVAVEPANSPVISQHLAGALLQPGPHKIQGIGAGFIPETLDLSLVDRVEQVSDEEAYSFARRLAREEGLLSGISCGAATAVAVRLAQLSEFKGKKIVVILPDSGERYLSGDLFDDA